MERNQGDRIRALRIAYNARRDQLKRDELERELRKRVLFQCACIQKRIDEMELALKDATKRVRDVVPLAWEGHEDYDTSAPLLLPYIQMHFESTGVKIEFITKTIGWDELSPRATQFWRIVL